MSRPSLPRRGTVAVLTAAMMVVLLIMVAMAIDIGYLSMARTELQRSADAAALAAADELLCQRMSGGNLSVITSAGFQTVRETAAEFASGNQVCRQTPSLQSNVANSANGDVVVGYMADPWDRSSDMEYSNPTQFNAVKVKIRRSREINGEVPLFFARVLGMQSAASEAEATAAFLTGMQGFRPPKGTEDLPLLPIALKATIWDSLAGGIGTDVRSWDNGAVRVGADGIPEINLYPFDTGASGNSGTVDIGPGSGSAGKFGRQIASGITPNDLKHHGGELALDANGELLLSGATGIKASLENDLRSIIGKALIVPLYRSISGNGTTAQYTIIGFGGIRIMAVDLNGSNKHVIVQPASVVTSGGIAGNGSNLIYSPVRLAR